MRKLALLITVLFQSIFVFSQRVEVSATLNRNKILIGEPVELYLKALVPKGSNTPWFVIDTLPHFEIMKKSVIDSNATERGIFLQQAITITSWDSGRWQLPPLALLRGRTQPLTIEVSYTPTDPNQPYHDIKDIMEVRKGEGSSWYWYLLGVAVLIALFLLFFPPSEKKKEVQTVLVDPYKEVMNKIEKLDPNGDPKVFQTELVAAFRTYVSRKKGIESHSKTTEDLVSQLKPLDLPSESFYKLGSALQLSDWVKFARYQPSSQEQRESMETVIANIKLIETVS